eukprot:sb/3470715/
MQCANMIRLLLFTATLCGTVICSEEWTAVNRDVILPWDLEETSLQIKTNSTLGSDDMIWVRMYDKDGGYISIVGVKFSSTMQYWIHACTSNYTHLPVQPPEEVDKIWEIEKTDTALIITCNDVEVLDYQFANSSDSRCVPKLDGDVVEQIEFSSTYDTASDFILQDCDNEDSYCNSSDQSNLSHLLFAYLAGILVLWVI